ncbi:MAG: glycosyltransferase family 2 protein, partial [Candidatus Gracilibacteria bacterium]
TYEVAKKAGVHAVRHSLNRGLGGALGTGLKLAVSMKWPIMVTFDADGQHDVNDIEKVCVPILQGKADVVIGSRMKNSIGMPFHRRILNFLGNLVTYAFFGIWCSDTQSGLRAFSLDAGKRIQIRTNRMEVSSEIIREIKVRGLKMVEVPIKAIYTDYSLSKGQSLYTGIKTFLKLLLHRLMH